MDVSNLQSDNNNSSTAGSSFSSRLGGNGTSSNNRMNESGDSSNSNGIMCMSASSTKMETVRFLHKWKIEQFSVQLELSEVGVELKSSQFGSDDDRYKFLLKLFPAGRDDECRGYLSLYLQIIQCPNPRLRFRVNFYIDTTEGPKSCTLNKNVVTINKGGTVTASKFFGSDSLKDTDAPLLNVNSHKSDLSADFGSLLRDPLHFDFVLHVGNRSFHLHKSILSARSLYFNAMFAHSENKEAQTNEVTLEDVSEDAVAGVLEYIYTGTCSSIDDHPDKILETADLLAGDFTSRIGYCMDKLKEECEAVLCNDISTANVCYRLKLADSYSAPNLRRRLVAFLRRNKAEILSSPEWEELEKTESGLVASVLRSLVIDGCGGGGSGSTASLTSTSLSTNQQHLHLHHSNTIGLSSNLSVPSSAAAAGSNVSSHSAGAPGAAVSPAFAGLSGNIAGQQHGPPSTKRLRPNGNPSMSQ